MGLIMGAYRKKPVTEKESSDEYNDKLICGASSMQGWRVSQEDAHNCILDFDVDTSLFAVYDGHGGHEVAEYCSQKLPDFIKNTPEYKEGKYKDALIAAFLGFDATITTPAVIEILKKMARDKEAMEESDEEEEEDEDNVDNLYEEAAMPIEEVIEKYKSNIVDAVVKRQEEAAAAKTKKESDSTVGTAAGPCSSSSSSHVDKCEDGVTSSSENEANEKNGNAAEKEANSSQADTPKIKISVPDSSDSKEANCSEGDTETKISVPDSSDTKEAAAVSTLSEDSENKTDNLTQNGEISTPSSEAQAKGDVSSSSTPIENGAVSKKGKGKAVIKPEPVKAPQNTRPKRNAQQLYKQWLDMGEVSDSEDTDEEDQTFEAPHEESSDDDAEEGGVNVAVEVDGSEEESSAEGEEEEDDKEEDEDDDKEELEEKYCMRNWNAEEPGSDSGCTAVVALLRGNELYVANAGDSRCVVCRNGKAIEMSFDHKPENKPERTRIVKAGGKVSRDGRVNDGLNLSRAIGDHTYKKNKDLSDREQMITSLPDIKTLTINNEDEFMVLACDGIWNSMSSQEVVDYIRPKLLEGREKMSQICEEMFDRCLAPLSLLDSSGCDNMTAIIIRFKFNTLKRSLSPHAEDKKDAKKAKTEDESEAQIDTTV